MIWFRKREKPKTKAEWVPGYETTRYKDWTRQVLRSDPQSVCDLSGLDSSRAKVSGVSYWVGDQESPRPGGLSYLLILEPENEFDSKAVAVYFGRRKVGHLSAVRAAAFTKLLAGLPFDAYRVNGMLENGKYPKLDLPTMPTLRAFVASL